MAPKPSDYRTGRPVPSDNPFEMFAWLFMRVSGVVLLFLAIGHLVIMHLINSIDNIDYQFVVERWATPFWRIYDGLMLILALLHGVNGLRVILDDYLRPGPWRTLWLVLLYTSTFVILFMGLLVLFTFQPR
jgi:succinate dehydrogenase / fumarate reductase membrane anchor subunit